MLRKEEMAALGESCQAGASKSIRAVSRIQRALGGLRSCIIVIALGLGIHVVGHPEGDKLPGEGI